MFSLCVPKQSQQVHFSPEIKYQELWDQHEKPWLTKSGLRMDKYLVIANFVETRSEYRESKVTKAGTVLTFVAWDSNLMREHWKMYGMN